MAYHLYSFEMNGNIYHCDIYPDEIDGYEINSKKINLNQMNLQKNDKFKMTYDFGCNWEFNIEVIDVLEKQNEKKYPYIVEGSGKGIIEDNGISALIKLVKLKESKKVPKCEGFYFDYTDFDLENLNKILHSEIRKIKKGFEEY